MGPSSTDFSPAGEPSRCPAPPPELLRLRSATAAYRAILTDCLPAIEAMAEYESPPAAALAEAIRAALELTDLPGTPAAIERLVTATMRKEGPARAG